MKLRMIFTLVCVAGAVGGTAASAQAVPIWPAPSFYTGFTGTNAQNDFKSFHLSGATGTAWAPDCSHAAQAFDDGSGFADDCFETISPLQAVVTDTSLESTVRFGLNPAGNTLEFHLNYKLENKFDGAVLEEKLDNGPWTDVVTAGGTFTTGGYDAKISTLTGNPLGSSTAKAWTGNSGGYQDEVLSLGPIGSAKKKHYAQFRFRLATDHSNASNFFRLDEFYFSPCDTIDCS